MEKKKMDKLIYIYNASKLPHLKGTEWIRLWHLQHHRWEQAHSLGRPDLQKYAHSPFSFR